MFAKYGPVVFGIPLLILGVLWVFDPAMAAANLSSELLKMLAHRLHARLHGSDGVVHLVDLHLVQLLRLLELLLDGCVSL